MNFKLILINVLNYLLYFGILGVHIYLYRYIQLDGMLVINSIAITSLFIIFLMFYWLNKYPKHKTALYYSMALNFINIIILVPAFFGHALLTP